MKRLVLGIGVATLLAFGIWACGSTDSGTTSSASPVTPTQTSVTVSSVSVAGSAPSIGSTSQLTATAVMSDGSGQSVTSQATWQSSATSVATVNPSGLVSGIAAGDADITATYQGKNGKFHVTLASATPTTYPIFGTVTDATSNGVLPNIAISATSRTTTTDGSGNYSMSGFSAGTVTVSAFAAGYVTSEKTASVSSDTRVDFLLERVAAPPSPSPTPTPSPNPTPSPTPGPSYTCNGATVPSQVQCPNNGGIQAPTAQCNDGTYSCSQNRSGTCSSHGGVSCYVCPGPLC